MNNSYRFYGMSQNEGIQMLSVSQLNEFASPTFCAKTFCIGMQKRLSITRNQAAKFINLELERAALTGIVSDDFARNNRIEILHHYEKVTDEQGEIMVRVELD